MKLSRIGKFLPGWKNALLAVVSAILLVLAFPDFEFWFLAWFALVPLLWAIEREKDSVTKSFLLGWLFGICFFFGSCWWLTYAPINYAGFSTLLAYALLLVVCLVVGLFPAFFSAILSFFLKRYGVWAMLAAPFVWVSTEFARYWFTGNNWNAIGYSQAFRTEVIQMAAFGGILLISWLLTISNVFFIRTIALISNSRNRGFVTGAILNLILLCAIVYPIYLGFNVRLSARSGWEAEIIAIQPNIPMSGLNPDTWKSLRDRHVALSEKGISEANVLVNDPKWNDMGRLLPKLVVIFPESPMNFMYEEDAEFQEFVRAFAAKNNVYVLFNAAEPDPASKKYFNSAVMVGPDGNKVAQYDKIYLMPFGESVPAPLQNIVPAFVGSFSYGGEYDLVPLGDAKAGVMICFESHFGELSREYVRNGADAIIEMTNDGYLGPTPILRQHLANAVFRAVETNRPVLRVTNVGITAYINERGQISDATEPYQEDTRIWSVSKSGGSQTFYVKYGDWFAWLCVIVTIALMLWSLKRKRSADGK